MSDSRYGKAFGLLDRAIQEKLYDMHWTELRPIQVDAIHHLIEGDGHLIVSAQTAGGKTEAAFLPILSKIIDDSADGVRAVYVGPLKALINDQFRRLEDLCERSDIPVHKWHGDVGQSRKSGVLQKPSGVLLITPESVESLFVNHPYQLAGLFGRLSFVVIDELHSFIGTERGAHLRSLVSRISCRSKEHIRLVGLSATIGEIDRAAAWLCPHGDRAVERIEADDEKTVRYIIHGYLRSQKCGAGPTTGTADQYDPVDSVETEDDIRLADDIVRTFSGMTALVFANSRSQLEFYADLVRRRLEARGLRNPFRIHHGSLSKAEREETEDALRGDVPTVAFCSSTLELGIDVGNVKAVGQIGAPWSVSSLRQRLGRSGRRDDEASTMYMLIEEDEPTQSSGIVDRLFPELLQAVAMTELMLDRWCEPPDTDRLHLSTLIQQVMSVITEKGGASAAGLYDALVVKGAFASIDQALFVDVLRSMGAHDLIEQAPEGALVLGLRGERIVRSFDFYSAFVTTKEFRVVHGGRTIGSIAMPPGMGADGYLILAGRRWKIIEVDTERQEITVEPSRGGRLPYFSGAAGADIHPRVRAQMRQVLVSDDLPAYLDARAKQLLQMSRETARESGVCGAPMLSYGRETVWFTWTGSKINRTLMAAGRYHLGLNVRDEGIALVFDNVAESTIRLAYQSCLGSFPSAEALAGEFPVKAVEKYESVLSDDLQALVLARNSLDTDGAICLIGQMY